jgi:radical SAM/Cys-rich protein
MNGGCTLDGRGSAGRGAASFAMTLFKHGISLERGKTTTLQVNVGLRCNQSCRHCHLNAGPGRSENMHSETAEAVIDYARRCGFKAIDITGGAPELNPNIVRLIEGLSAHTERLMFRSNLNVLNDGKRKALMSLLKEKRAVIVASFPSLNEAQTDAQRVEGIFKESIDALRKLNDQGYGNPETGEN